MSLCPRYYHKEIRIAFHLGHSIIPHHHHADHHLSEYHQTNHHHNEPHQTNHHHNEHHQANHNHNDENENNGLGDIFSLFVHPTEGIVFTTNHNVSNTFSKELFLIVAVLPDTFYFDKFLIPPLLYKPPLEQLIYFSPHSLSSGLRAPPVFIS